jgi:hypothetical protein
MHSFPYLDKNRQKNYYGIDNAIVAYGQRQFLKEADQCYEIIENHINELALSDYQYEKWKQLVLFSLALKNANESFKIIFKPFQSQLFDEFENMELDASILFTLSNLISLILKLEDHLHREFQ